MVNSPDIKRKIRNFAVLGVLSLSAALVFHYVSGLDRNQMVNWQKDVEDVLRMKEEKLQKILENVLD